MLDPPHPKEPTEGIKHHAHNLGWNSELGLISASITSDQEVCNDIHDICSGKTSYQSTKETSNEEVAVPGGGEEIRWSRPDLCDDVGGRDV